MSVLLIDDLEWRDTKNTELPPVGTKCYIRMPKRYENGEKSTIYDIVATEVRESSIQQTKFFYRSGNFKRNMFNPESRDVEAWAYMPEESHVIKQLLPCPFCGGKATLHHEEAYEDDYGDMPEHWWVGCDDSIVGRKTCHMLVQTGLFLSKDKAVDAWNTRKR